MVSIIHNMLVCFTVLSLAFMILLSQPKSMLRSVVFEVGGMMGAALAALYVVSPIDLIPDVIPVLGWIDDVAVAIGGVGSAAMAYYGHRDRKSLQSAEVKNAQKP